MKASELFTQIETLVGSIGGWSSVEKCCEFASIVLGHRPKVTVELGTWMGRGAFSMALTHRFVGCGQVWVVDPWSGGESAADMEGVNKDWWIDQKKHDQAFNDFHATLANFDLGPWVHVQRKKSDEAVMPTGIGLLVVDGNHGNQAVNDVERWAPMVAKGGIVYLDDLNWTGGAVAQAGKRLLELGFSPLYARDEGMFYQKMR